MVINSKGILLIDKPRGITSRGLVDIVTSQINLDSLGHSGTLDPNASGLMILLSGEAKKIQNLFTGLEKCYTALIELGASSDTDDEEGHVVPWSVATIPSLQKIEEVLLVFIGTILQAPPPYSAIKIKGRRAYDLARRGQKIELSARKVHIYSIKVCAYDYPYLSLEINCSAGVYIRALARDIGAVLKTGGYLKNLRRISVGQFNVAQAATLEKLTRDSLISLEIAVAHFPQIILTPEMWNKVRHGQVVACHAPQTNDGHVFLWLDNSVIAWANVENGFIHPKRLLVTPNADWEKI